MAPEARKRTRLALLVHQQRICDRLARHEMRGVSDAAAGASSGACPVRVSDERCAFSLVDDQRCRHQVAGLLARQQRRILAP